MPVFISDEEFTVIRTAGDVGAVAEKADAYIQGLFADIETVKAKADAASITAEQTCSILEQKYISLSSEFAVLESRNSQLDTTLQQRSSELAQIQSEKHQLHIKFIEKDGEIERLKTEVSELQKSKRQLVELVGGKDTEISEKNSTIKLYLDKISNLTDRAAQREARASEVEAEILRCRACCETLKQEKELIEKHNAWLNAELTTKVDSFLELRRKSAEMEADMSTKLTDIEKQYNECSNSLNWHKERVRELDLQLETLQQALCSAKDDASTAEQRYSVEISTVSKLVELYKESSEEWSKKAGDLEGVIKALETHLSQAEKDYKEKLEKEATARKEAEKVALELTEKVAKLDAELESSRRASELDILPLSSFTSESLTYTASTNDHAIVPHVAAGVSGTALAASLLREGWSLAKMYGKYQEAADALHHEQMGRKQTEAILERVLFEIEEKASVLLDERAEHERMAEAYALMNQKLQQSLSEHDNLEKVIRELKAEVKKCEREYNYAQKEITDLQKQVTILLKECRDVQLRCGSVNPDYMDDDVPASLTEVADESDIQKVISEHLLSVKDIKGLVEQNAKLRSLVRSLSDEVENRGMQVKEQFGEELQKQKAEAASRVAAVLERAEEQAQMIESLHSSVSMFRRLYEEEHRLRSSQSQTAVSPSVDRRSDFMVLLEGSQETTKKAQEHASERIRSLEDDLARQKAEITSVRSERDRLALEASFAREKLERFLKEFDHQRQESNGILVRNIEFSQIIVDYQKKMRESSDSVQATEDLSRKLKMELSVLSREKELLLHSEKRALDEVQDLSQRVYRLQATLDTVQSSEEVREQARATERRKQEEYIKKIEREWAEAKKELQEERNNVRALSLDREHILKDGTRQVEEMGKKLEAALQAVAAAEVRAAAAEVRYSDLERSLKLAEAKTDGQDGGLELTASVNEAKEDLNRANQEIERLKSEASASKDHMLQYKGIAEVNEAALRQIEAAHESFRIETEQLKKSLEAEIQSLRNRVLELEIESSSKSKEAASATIQKDEALASASAEITVLKEQISNEAGQLTAMEAQVSVLKEDLESAHQRAHTAQANYERQVILQSETIQELTRTSKALSSAREEVSALERTVDAYKSENIELKSKWVSEKSELERLKNQVQKKYDELSDQNKILHSELEALHIKLAEKETGAAGVAQARTCDDPQSEAGLHRVVSYLRRTKEIAETEISLLRQEKLRLQSQLERAVKAAEAAETSLIAERTNSRSLLFTEDEFKALKLQVSEMNLLRESNMQLREENKHNFEECQKLREVAQVLKLEAEESKNILREREIEVEGVRKEVVLYKKEKEQLEKRISDMFEASKNLNLEDYNRLKSELEDLQASMREKEAVIEDAQKLISQKQEVISKLEQDLESTRKELTERDALLEQVKTLRLEVDKQRKISKRLLKEKDSLSKEKESVLKEKESLFNVKQAVVKENSSLSKEKEVLVKEKEELSKEKQAISKQLEDLRREKKTAEDTTVDPAMGKKENEKDTRIQILESMITKFRKDSKKERDVILSKCQTVDTERNKFTGELERQKVAVAKISDELEKLKHARDSLPEGTSVVNLLSGNTLDGLASAYVLAIENFEREAQVILKDVNQGSASNSSTMDASSVVTSTIQTLPVGVPKATQLTAPRTYQPPKSEEREKKVALPKGRRLVRPRLPKSGELHRSVETSDLDGPKNAVNPSSAQEIAVKSSIHVSSEASIRKRPASPSPSELQEEQVQPGDSSIDFPEPSTKRSKGSDPLQEDVQTEAVAQENVETVPTVEELLDAVSDVPQDLAYEASDFVKDVETVEGQGNEAGVSQQQNDTRTLDIERDNIDNEEDAGETNEVEQTINETSEIEVEEDGQIPMIDANDGEEGEMLPESSDFDAGDDPTITGSQDAIDVQPEHSTAASMPSPSQADADADPSPMDVNEGISPDISNANEEMEEGELAEEIPEDPGKSNNGDERTVGDTDHSGVGAVEGTTVSREDGFNVGSGQEQPHPSLGPTTINLADRAKERAARRLGLPSPASGSASASASACASASASTSTRAPTPLSATRRGRGGPLTRNRGRRGGRQS